MPRRTPVARSCASCHRAGGIRLDASTGLVTAHAGVSFDDLLRHLVPQGYFVPVTPGTRFVTLGGAIASDVHGKNHHVDGSFGNHLRSMSMLMADGAMLELTAESDPELWWATIGGMGLTGIVVEATFAALRIETSRCVVDTTRTDDLDSLLAAMADGDEQLPVLGRLGRPARQGQASRAQRADARRSRDRRAGRPVIATRPATARGCSPPCRPACPT